VSGRLDDERLETLRSWGAGLAADERDELRAAGKAILILVEEIDRLQVDIWHERQETSGSPEPAAASGDTPQQERTAAAEAIDSTLRARVRKLLGSRSA
jgi:hypothetical protein